MNNITLYFETNVELVPSAVISISGIKGITTSVNSQTPGGTALLNTQMDDKANSVVISVSDVSVLPIRLVEAVYLQIEDDPSTLHIETEVVRVLRIGACSGVGSNPSGMFACTYSPNELNNEQISPSTPISCKTRGLGSVCLQTWILVFTGGVEY